MCRRVSLSLTTVVLRSGAELSQKCSASAIGRERRSAAIHSAAAAAAAATLPPLPAYHHSKLSAKLTYIHTSTVTVCECVSGASESLLEGGRSRFENAIIPAYYVHM